MYWGFISSDESSQGKMIGTYQPLGACPESTQKLSCPAAMENPTAFSQAFTTWSQELLFLQPGELEGAHPMLG